MDSVDWSQIPSDVAVIGAFFWGVTKGIPNIIDTFKEELQRQRTEFRDELTTHREQSARLAEAGHQTVKTLSVSVKEMADNVKNLNGNETK